MLLCVKIPLLHMHRAKGAASCTLLQTACEYLCLCARWMEECSKFALTTILARYSHPTNNAGRQPPAVRLKRVVTLGREFNVQMGVFASLAPRPGCTELELIAEKIRQTQLPAGRRYAQHSVRDICLLEGRR